MIEFHGWEKKNKIYNNGKVATPFSLLSIFDSIELQKKTAEIFINEKSK